MYSPHVEYLSNWFSERSARLSVAISIVALTVGVSMAPALPASADIVATPAVAAGMEHTCVLSDQGRVWCWGENGYGSLGDGTYTDSNLPVAVTGLTDAVALSGGVRHTCALRATGTVVCWGRNDLSQLGNGNNNHSNVPTEVVNLTGVTAIGSGGNHACAILAGGAVKCWGFNGSGQLGNATNGAGTNSNVPVDVLLSVGGPPLTGATAVDGGLRHECAIVASGAMKCWGHNAYGQLGTGNTNESNVPVDVTTSAGTPLTGMSALGMSDQFFSCAMSGGGMVSCWGQNGDGQLGTGNTNDSNVPVAVLNLPAAASVGSGLAHVCAALTDGTAKCWGDGSRGQLGNGMDGSGVASNVPVVVPNLSGVIAVDGGYYHTCAILRSGTVRCWGDNVAGELGIGTNTNSNVPIEIQGLVLVTPVVVPIWRTTLDPAGGSCLDGATRTEPWTTAFVGYRYLPGASDCTRSGYTFAGWADEATPTVVRQLPMLTDPSEGLQRYFVAENLDLIAVWTPIPRPEAITNLQVFANFLCRRCTTAWLIHTPTTAAVTIAVDNKPKSCARSATVFGLAVCELTNLSSGTHTVTLEPAGGVPTTTSFVLRS